MRLKSVCLECFYQLTLLKSFRLGLLKLELWTDDGSSAPDCENNTASCYHNKVNVCWPSRPCPTPGFPAPCGGEGALNSISFFSFLSSIDICTVLKLDSKKAVTSQLIFMQPGLARAVNKPINLHHVTACSSKYNGVRFAYTVEPQASPSSFQWRQCHSPKPAGARPLPRHHRGLHVLAQGGQWT